MSQEQCDIQFLTNMQKRCSLEASDKTTCEFIANVAYQIVSKIDQYVGDKKAMKASCLPMPVWTY